MQTPKHYYNPFYTKNNYIYNQIKKHTYEKYLAQFFCSYPFQILKKAYLRISK